MARAIDGELLELEIANIANKLAKSDAQKALMGRVMYCVEHMPTIPQPSSEPPPCYQPDGDGCAYQCYDGDDEPIDKCKECPLCYSDKQRHHTPPNEPLTLEDAKKERYIWFTPLNDWAKVTPFGVLFFGSEELMNWETLCEEWGYRFKAYRRPPEVSP